MRRIKDIDYVLVDDSGNTLISVVGQEPYHQPYIRVGTVSGEFIGACSHKSKLRALAKSILRAIGDE